MRPILKLLGFVGPQIKELRPIDGPWDLFCFFGEVIDDWERYRKDEEVVELFYNTLDYMNIEVPDYLREPELDWKLYLKIMDFNNPKSGSFVDLAQQFEISKDTLKKILGKVQPELALKLRNRKKLSGLEHYLIIEELGIYKDYDFDPDDDALFEGFNFIRKSNMYKLFYTDKKTLESNLSEPLKQRIYGLNIIPPILLKEVRDELEGSLPKRN